MYKTIVIKYTPHTKEMAAKIEEAANKMEKSGYELVTFSITPSAKAILMFKKADE
ncbi:MAG TPA: hypothetical protein IAB17_01025 [Candidatus Alectryocaccobium stercorigallinarum]|jgi:ABC-type uncharacterized transport system substrate-binding protein|nr:hypothetical protein [Candidatus Alectryocaccobium stercorigallinarum]